MAEVSINNESGIKKKKRNTTKPGTRRGAMARFSSTWHIIQGRKFQVGCHAPSRRRLALYSPPSHRRSRHCRQVLTESLSFNSFSTLTVRKFGGNTTIPGTRSKFWGLLTYDIPTVSSYRPLAILFNLFALRTVKNTREHFPG